MLFYAVVAFALITKGADALMIVLAWLFVLTRLVHAAIHIGPNKVRWRAPAFALGFAHRRHHVDQARPALVTAGWR